MAEQRVGYFSAFPGRMVLAATGLFMAGPALTAVLGRETLTIRLYAILPMLGAAALILAAGFGMARYPKQTAVFLLWLPFLLWMTFTGFGVMAQHGWSVGTGVLITAVVFLIAAARPTSGAKAGHFA